MKYKNYIFDLYGTLVDIRTDEDKAEVWDKLTLFYGYYRAIYAPEELRRSFYELVESGEAAMRQETGAGKLRSDAHEVFPELEIEQVFLELFRRRGVEADAALAVHAGQFFRILSTEYLRLYDGVKELLAALAERGGNIYLLSNAQRIFTEYEMNILGIADYFDDILISSSCGVRKPDSRFFELLQKRHGLLPDESIMIGNDLQNDIEGAKQVGLHTFYIHSNISPELTKKPEADYVQMGMDMEAVRRSLLGKD